MKALKSNECFIIGGGPSIGPLIPKLNNLSGDIITTNTAYKLFPNAKHHHFADYQWWLWNKEHYLKTCTGTKSTIWNEYVTQGLEEYESNKIGMWYRSENDIEKFIYNDRLQIGGHNSGHQAINIAYYMGYDTMYLIGFDMDTTAPQMNYHSEHKTQTVPTMYDIFFRGFENLAKAQQEYKFNVVNLNPLSKLKCFEFDNIEHYIGEL